MSLRPKLIPTLSCLTLLVCGCAVTVGGRTNHAVETATAAHMQRVEYQASPFVLTGWQKLTRTGEPIYIYIEGDGLAWLGRTRPSPNPTPKIPVALLLASRDTSANIIYLARPCQYTAFDMAGNKACADVGYWGAKRFSQEVVNSYMTVLDEIALRTGTTEFQITGFSGGANIAGLLAARRSDITQIRTVAGNVDNDYFTKFHGVSAMPDSLNMANDAAKLSNIPQIHFIGADDRIIPVEIYKSYASKTGATPCLQFRIVPDITHNEGWENAWDTLLHIPAVCK